MRKKNNGTLTLSRKWNHFQKLHFRFTFISVFTLWVRMILISEDLTAVYNMCESCMKVDTVVHEIGRFPMLWFSLRCPYLKTLGCVMFCSFVHRVFAKKIACGTKTQTRVIWQWKMQDEASKGFHISPNIFCFNRSIPFRKCQKKMPLCQNAMLLKSCRCNFVF